MIWLMVAVGGALGAMARYGLSLCFPLQPSKFPIATFSANIIGCFIMGILYVVIVEKTLISPQWRFFLNVGFLGALTTFSTFSLEAFLMWQQQHLLLACVYVLTTSIGCLLAVWAGYRLFHFISPLA
jgi:fluoride exporter